MSLPVSEAIAHRRAVRQYTSDPVPDEVLDRVVSQALEAPSAFNLQARDLVVVREQAVKQALFDASGQPQILSAPVVLVAVGRTNMLVEDSDSIVPPERLPMIEGFVSRKTASQRREDGVRDAMLVASFALLAATAEGLATSPMSGWDEEKVKAAIGVQNHDDYVVALVIAMGYGAESPAHPGRVASRRVNDTF